MSRSTYRCDGCRIVLECRDDLVVEQGEVRRRWTCVHCGTTVPSTVAERIQHQRQHEPDDRPGR